MLIDSTPRYLPSRYDLDMPVPITDALHKYINLVLGFSVSHPLFHVIEWEVRPSLYRRLNEKEFENANR